MTLAKATTKWLITLALALCVIPVLTAQTEPPPSQKVGKAKARAVKPVNSAKPAKAAKTAALKPVAQAPARQEASPAADGLGGPRRDPFLPLINERKDGGNPEHLPPGKAGLVITTVRVDGTVRAPEGMIAVLSNADQRVYFVREGDQLYDGAVEKIGLDGVTFRQNSKDAFGKPVERVVTKRIYASAGEQQ